ncbi:MAG TPA: PepSY-associated TM helix domain-containing protein, partial [Steroidobacteraceae bacterium]|nr:PepSY-associated TM helix domain-containing protein [Steroidobacteraceae bacterium]
LRSHSAWGAVMILLATLSVATGAMLVFSQPTLSALKWLMPADAAPRPDPPMPVVAPGAAIDWRQVVRNAEAVFADDQLVFVIAPQAERAHLTIRARRAAEWHPNGRSEILLEPGTGNVLAVRDATAAAAAERVFNKIYPLHVARGSVAPLQPLTVLTGAVLCGLALTGLAGWLGRERIRRRVAAQSLTGRGPASEPANRTNG